MSERGRVQVQEIRLGRVLPRIAPPEVLDDAESGEVEEDQAVEEGERAAVVAEEEEEQQGDGGDGELRQGKAQEEAESFRGSSHLVQEDHAALA